jgi:hypothetical protein
VCGKRCVQRCNLLWEMTLDHGGPTEQTTMKDLSNAGLKMRLAEHDLSTTGDLKGGILVAGSHQRGRQTLQ